MKAQVKQLLTLQVVAMTGYLILIFCIARQEMASAVLGCLASLVPALYFSLRMLRCSFDDATQWLGHAYRSDIGKWVMAGVIFALAFSSGYPWDPVILFVGYLLVQMSALFLPIMYKGN